MNPKTIVPFLVALLLAAASASAHAYLDHASPRVGSVVNVSPAEIRLWFTQSLEPGFSRADLRSSAGVVIGAGGVDPQKPQEMVISTGPLPPGKYKVRWRILSVDTHRTEGSFSFEVKP
jgi:methionine-rich copper-binding protein CopC